MLFIYILTLSVSSICITSFVKISIQFLPPRQSTSLPACNNVFYSCFSTTKKHRGQRGTALCRAALPSAGTNNEILWTSQSIRGMESFAHLEKTDLQKVCIRSPKFPYSFLRELSTVFLLLKLKRLFFLSSELKISKKLLESS